MQRDESPMTEPKFKKIAGFSQSFVWLVVCDDNPSSANTGEYLLTIFASLT